MRLRLPLLLLKAVMATCISTSAWSVTMICSSSFTATTAYADRPGGGSIWGNEEWDRNGTVGSNVRVRSTGSLTISAAATINSSFDSDRYSTVAIDRNGTLALNGGGTFSGSLSGTGKLEIGSDVSLNGGVGGGLQVTLKNGSSGNRHILTIGDNAAFASCNVAGVYGEMEINSGSTLSLSGQSSFYTVKGSGIISMLSGAGVSLNGNVAGTVSLSSGSLLTAGGNISIGSVGLGSGSEINTGLYTVTLSGYSGNSLKKTGTGMLVLGNAGNLSSITFEGGLSFSGNLTGSNSVMLTGAATLINSGSNQNVTISRSINTDGRSLVLLHGTNDVSCNGAILGNGALSETGNGILSLGAFNQIGAFTSDGGRLVLNHSGAMGGTGTLMTFTNGGEIILGAHIDAGNRSLTAGGNAMTITGGGYNLVLGNFTSSGLVKTGNGTLKVNELTTGTIDLAGTLSFTGLSGTGSISLTGESVLDSRNSLTTACAIGTNGRVLTLAHDSNNAVYSGNITGGGHLKETGAGDLTLGGVNGFGAFTSDGGKLVLMNAGALDGNGIMNFSGNAEIAMSGTSVTNTSRSINAANQEMTISGGMYNLTLGDFTSGRLVKTGSGILTVGSLTAGTVNLQGTLSFAEFNGEGDIVLSGPATLKNTAEVTISRNISGMTDLTLAHGEVDAFYTGDITGNLNLFETGRGDLTLSGNNSLGRIESDGGILNLASEGAIGGSGTELAFSGGSTVNVNAAISTSRVLSSQGQDLTLNLAGNTFVIGGIKLAGSLGSTGDLIKTGTGLLTVDGADNEVKNLVFEGGLTLASLNDMDAGITLTGNGTLTLGAVMELDQRDLVLNSHDLNLVLNGNVNFNQLKLRGGSLNIGGTGSVLFDSVDGVFHDLSINDNQNLTFAAGDVSVAGTLAMGTQSSLSASSGSISVTSLTLTGGGHGIKASDTLSFVESVSLAVANDSTELTATAGSLSFDANLTIASDGTIAAAGTDLTVGGNLLIAGTASMTVLTARGNLNVTGTATLAGTDTTLHALGGLNFGAAVMVGGSGTEITAGTGAINFAGSVTLDHVTGLVITSVASDIIFESGLVRTAGAGDLVAVPVLAAGGNIAIWETIAVHDTMDISAGGSLTFTSISAGVVNNTRINAHDGVLFNEDGAVGEWSGEMNITGGCITAPSLKTDGSHVAVRITGTEIQSLTGKTDVTVDGGSELILNDVTGLAVGEVHVTAADGNGLDILGGSRVLAGHVLIEGGENVIGGASSVNSVAGFDMTGGTTLVAGGAQLTGDVRITGGGDTLPNDDGSESIRDKKATLTLTGQGTLLTGGLVIGGEGTGLGSARIASLAEVTGDVIVSGAGAWLVLDNARLGGNMTVDSSNLYVTGRNNSIHGNVILAGESKVNIYDGVFSISGTLTLGTGDELNISQLDNTGGITGGEFIGTVVVDGGTINLRRSGKITGEIFFGSTVATGVNSGTMNVADNTTWITESDITFNRNGIMDIAAGSSVELKGNANLNGAGKLTKLGEGDLIINTNNAVYSGDIVLSQGQLTLGATGALGNAGTLKAAGGTRLQSVADMTTGKALELDGSSFVINTASTLQWIGAVTLSATASDHVLTKDGLGNLTLTAAVLNDVRINNGILTLGAAEVTAEDVTLDKGAGLVNRGTITSLTGGGNNTILIDGGTVAGTTEQAGGALTVRHGTLGSVNATGTVITAEGTSSLGTVTLTGGSLSMTHGTLAGLTTQTDAANVDLTGVTVAGPVATAEGDFAAFSSILAGGLSASGTKVTLTGTEVGDSLTLDDADLTASAGSMANLSASNGTTAVLDGTRLTGALVLADSGVVLARGELSLTSAEVDDSRMELRNSTGALGSLGIKGTGVASLTGGAVLTSGNISTETNSALSLTEGAGLTGGKLSNSGSAIVNDAALTVTELDNAGTIAVTDGSLAASAITELGNITVRGVRALVSSLADADLGAGLASFDASTLKLGNGDKTLTISGSGVLTLDNNARLLGNLVLAAGTTGHASLTGSSLSGDLTVNDGVASLAGSSIGGSALITAGTLNLTESSITGNLTLNEAGNLIINGVNTVGGVFTNDGNVTMNGSITVTGESVIGGMLTIANTWTGNIRINGTAGNVILAAPNGFVDGNITFGTPGGRLTLETVFTTKSKVIMDGAGTIDLGNHKMTVNGELEGSGALTVAGTGSLALTRTNSRYSGSITLERGSLLVSADQAMGSGALNVKDGTALFATGDITLSNMLNLNDGVEFTINTAGTLDWTASMEGEGTLKKDGLGNLILHFGALDRVDVLEGTLTLGSSTAWVDTVTLEQGSSLVNRGYVGSLTGKGGNTMVIDGGTVDMGLEMIGGTLTVSNGNIAALGAEDEKLTASGTAITVNGSSTLGITEMAGGSLNMTGGQIVANDDALTVLKGNGSVIGLDGVSVVGNVSLTGGSFTAKGGTVGVMEPGNTVLTAEAGSIDLTDTRINGVLSLSKSYMTALRGTVFGLLAKDGSTVVMTGTQVGAGLAVLGSSVSLHDGAVDAAYMGINGNGQLNLSGSTAGNLGEVELRQGKVSLSGGASLYAGFVNVYGGDGNELILTGGSSLNITSDITDPDKDGTLQNDGLVLVDNSALNAVDLNNGGTVRLVNGARLRAESISSLGSVDADGVGTKLISVGNVVLNDGKTTLNNSAVFEIASGSVLTVSDQGVLELRANSILKGDVDAGYGARITLDGSSMTGDLNVLEGAHVALASSALTGDLNMSGGNVSLNLSTIDGNVLVTAGELTMTESSVTGNLTVDVHGNLVINGANYVGGIFTSNGNVTMNGTIFVTGYGDINDTLTINNRWTGNIRINGADGNVILGHPNGFIDGNIAFGTAGEAATAGGTLTLQTDFTTGRKVVLTQDGTIALGTSQMTVNGELEGAGTLTVTGTGTLALGYGNAGFTGDMNLDSGMTLRLDHADALNAKGSDVLGTIAAADGVTILSTVTSTVGKNITSEAGALNLDTNDGTVLTVTGETSVTGSLIKKGTGDLVLAGKAALGTLDILNGDVTVTGAGSTITTAGLAASTSLTGDGTSLGGITLGDGSMGFGAGSGLLTGTIVRDQAGKGHIAADITTESLVNISRLVADFAAGSSLTGKGAVTVADSNLNLLDTVMASTEGRLELSGTTLDTDGSTLYGAGVTIKVGSSIDLDNNSTIWSTADLVVENSDLAANDSLIHGDISINVTGSELELRNDSTLSSAGLIAVAGSHLTMDDSTITTAGDVALTGSELDMTADSMIYAGGTLTLSGIAGDMSDSSLIGSDIVLNHTVLDAYAGSRIKGGDSITLDDETQLNLTDSSIEAGLITLDGGSGLNLTNSDYTADTSRIVDGALLLTGSETKAALGELEIGTEGSLMLNNVQSAFADIVTNAGDIALVNGSVLTVTDTLTNSGSIGLVSSSLNAEDIANEGTITLKNGSTLTGDTLTQTGADSLLELNDTSHVRLAELEVNAGNVTLSGASTLDAGSVTHTGGTVTLNQGTALTASNGYLLDGGTLNVNFATLTGNLTAMAGTATLTHSMLKGDIRMIGASTVSITDQSLIMGSILLNNGGSLTIRDSIVDGSVTVNGDTADAWLTLDNATINYHLTVTGDTTLTLNRTNTVKGTSTIDEGSTIIGNGTIIALNQVFDIKGTYVLNNQHKGDLTIADTGLLRLKDGAELTGNILFFNTDLTTAGEGRGARIEVAGSNGNKNFRHSGDLLVKIDGSINTVGAGDGYTLKGQMEGLGDLTKLGVGSLTLESADSTFRGDLLLQEGSLILKATEALGDYGTLAFTGDNVTVQTTKDMTLSKNIAMEDAGLLAHLNIAKNTTLNLAGDIDIQGTLSLTNLGTLDITGDDSYLNTVNLLKGAMDVSGRGNRFDTVTLREGTRLASDGDNSFGNLTANRGTIVLDGSIHGSDTVDGDILLSDKSDLTIIEGIMDAADRDMTLSSGSKAHFIDTTGVMGSVTLDGTDTAWDILNTKPSLGQNNGALELTGDLESNGFIHMRYADMTVNGTTDILNTLLMENSLLNGRGAMTLGGMMDTTVTLDKSSLTGDTTLDLVNARTTATESLIKGNDLAISGGTTELVNNSTLEGTNSLIIKDGAEVTLTDSDLEAGRLDVAQASDTDDSSLTLNDSEMNVGGDMNIGGRGEVTLNGSTGTVGGDLALDNSGSLTLDKESSLIVAGGTNLTDSGSLLVDGDSSLTTGTVTADGNSSLTVTSGSSLEIMSGAGETAMDLSGDASLTVTGTGKGENTPTLDTNGGDIIISGSSNAIIKDALVDLDYDGTLVLKDEGSLTLTDTTILGNVATEGDSEFHLTLENVTIKKDPSWTGDGERGGNLTVTGGNLTLIGDNVAEGTVSVSENASITIKDGGSLTTDTDDDIVVVDPDGEVNIGGGKPGSEGGTLNSDLVLRGGEVNLNAGAVINGDILYIDTDPAAERDRVINVNDDFTLDEGRHLIVDTTQGDNILDITGGKSFTLDGNMAGDADLTLSGSGTLVLNSDNSKTVEAHGQHGEYEGGYTGDILMTGGGTIVLGADEAMGSEGSLIVSGEDAMLATEEKVSSCKDIHAEGADLEINTIGTGAELTLTEDALVTTGADGSLTKTGSGVLTLDGTGVDIENFNITAGTTNVNGIGGDHNDIEVTTITGDARLNITGSTLDGDLLNVDGGTTHIEDSTLNMDMTGTTGTVNVGENVTINGDITFDINADGSNGTLVNVNKDFNFGSGEHSLVVNDHGTINVADNTTMTLNGNLTGNGHVRNAADNTLTKDGEGKLVITTSNTAYTGNLEHKAGTIDVSNTLDALGTGMLVSTGDATVNILAANGVVKLGNGIAVEGGHTLTLNTESETAIRNNTFSGTEGRIDKIGGERLILDNIRGAAMTGTDLNVKEGLLHLTGTELGNRIAMEKDTVLEGSNSKVGSVLAQKGSSIHLGLDKVGTGSHNGYGTLTVADRLEMNSGSSFFVDISGDSLRNDNVTVAPGGVAHLNGATVVINDRGGKDAGKGVWKDEQRYQIVSTDTIGSGFDWHVDGLYYLNAHLEQNAGGIDLVLTQNHKGAYGKTPNQTQVSGALENIDNAGKATGELKDMLHAFEHTQSREEALKALESAGGLGLTTLMNQQIVGNLNHMRNVSSAIGTGTGSIRQEFDGKGMFIGNGFTPQNQVWVQSTGACSSINNDGNGSGFDRNSWGMAAGFERSLSKEFMLGLAFSYEDVDVKTSNPAMGGSSYDSENIYFDLYAKWRKGPWQMKGLVGFSNTDISLDRDVSVASSTGASFMKHANGGTTGAAFNLAYELSYDFALNESTLIQPLFTIESSGNTIKGYTESGSIGNAGLTIQDQDAWMTTLGLGARLVKDFTAFSNAPRGRVQVRALVTNSVGDQASTVDAAFIGAQETRYILSPADQQRVGFLIGADILMPITSRTSIFAGGSAEFKGSDQNITGNLGVRYTF